MSERTTRSAPSQSDLFSLAPVHQHDPVESREAAAKVDAATQYRMVLVCLYFAGDEGLTDDELGRRCGLLRHAAGTRRGVARDRGLVEKAGRGVSDLGNPAGLWRLTPDGRAWVERLKAAA